MGLKAELEKKGIKAILCEPLNRHTAFGVGGVADLFVVPDSKEKLIFALDIIKRHGVNFFLLGGGSNVLCSDKGFRGAVIWTGALNGIEFNEKLVTVSAGEKISSLIKACKSKGLNGLGFLAGVPASVGGAVFMNAGAFNKCIGDLIVSVTAVDDGELKVFSREKCDFSYRESIFKNRKLTVVSATFMLNLVEDDSTIYLLKRREKQPQGKTCGSVFKNPNGEYSARLIEGAGLKGFKINGAKISEKHANFIVNYNNATANDIYSLIKKVQETVYNKYGIKLKEEVIYLGEF